MKTVAVASAVAAVTKTLEKAVDKAAGNGVLSKAEQTKLPYFAQRELNEVRQKAPGKLLGVAKAQKVLHKAVQAAIEAAGLATTTSPAKHGVLTLMSAGQIGEAEIQGLVQKYIKKHGKEDASVSPLMEGAWLSDFTDALTQTFKKTYKKATDVPAGYKAMVLASGDASTYGSKSLKDLFDQVDQGEILVREAKDKATGQRFVVVDYGAGDNTYGAIFDAKTKKLLAQVIDGNIELR